MQSWKQGSEEASMESRVFHSWTREAARLGLPLAASAAVGRTKQLFWWYRRGWDACRWVHGTAAEGIAAGMQGGGTGSPIGSAAEGTEPGLIPGPSGCQPALGGRPRECCLRCRLLDITALELFVVVVLLLLRSMLLLVGSRAGGQHACCLCQRCCPARPGGCGTGAAYVTVLPYAMPAMYKSLAHFSFTCSARAQGGGGGG